MGGVVWYIEFINMDQVIDLTKLYVYIFWEGEVPLYVGLTRNLINRLHSHRINRLSRLSTADRIELISCEETEGRRVERAMITKLRPLFNKNNNPEMCN
jgi:predicted GIY-YIG superfamily endonuclease